MSTSRSRLYVAVFGASVVAAVACGARTGLDVPDYPSLPSEAGPDAEDAGPDVVDAGPDVADAGPDVVDAGPDAPVVTDCADAGVTYIYLISEQNELFAFYPPSLSLTKIGTISCPDSTAPFSMAVDRKGIAYVVFQSGNLFRVSTLTASCEPTAYQSSLFGKFARTFGMGFSADMGDPGETLYIASTDPFGTTDGGPTPELLGTIDLTTFQRSTIGQFPYVIGSAELTGTGDGRLFGFGVDEGVALRLLQIDKANAAILSNTPLQLGAGAPNLNDWAFAFWGGSFYFFTSTPAQHAPNGTPATTISRYDLANPSTLLQHVLDIPNVNIDGAGVSTCAPQQ